MPDVGRLEARRRDGLPSIMEVDEADGMPPMHLLEVGAGGCPNAKVFIWRRVFIARDSAFKWRLVETSDHE